MEHPRRTRSPPHMTESDLTPRRRRLPNVSLPALGGGAAVPLRAPRRGTVLVLLGADATERDAGYLRALADAEPSLREWDGRVLVLVEGDDAARPPLAGPSAPFPVLLDREGAVARAAGVAAPAVVVVDQWGEVHVAQPVAVDWLAVSEVEGWLRLMAIRCAG
jgi:hypothetical protein